MKDLLAVWVATFALCLAACHKAQASQGVRAFDKSASLPSSAVSTRLAAGAISAPGPVRLLDDNLKGMAYSEFRKIVLGRGWQPKPDEQCMANVVGGDYKELCSEHPELGLCRACAEVRELSSCSGDGYCLMQFRHDGFDKTLQVGTYGRIGDWNAPAAKSSLSVTGWEYRSHADE